MQKNTQILEILQSFWPRNKAKGLLAQTVLMQEIESGVFGSDAGEKIFQGCWLFAPKENDFYKFRFCFFVHPVVMKSGDFRTNPKSVLGQMYRPFYAISDFMNNSGVGIIYAIALTESGELPLEDIKNRNFAGIEWRFLYFNNGKLVEKNPIGFFGGWEGSRGRAGKGGNRDEITKEKFEQIDEKVLTDLLLNELFYTGFVKGVLKKPVNDPYDVDSFLLSISQKYIFPMEIKEKFAGKNGNEKFFGIDAGRVMMLLRLCLPNDSNSIYLIREVDESARFIGWKYMTFTDLIMTSSWNLQAGGIGMGGQNTQTIRLPYDKFRDFDKTTITEENLKKIGNLPKDIKEIAKQFGSELSARFRN